MRRARIILLILCIVYFVFAIVACSVKHYQVNRDIDYWLNRARVAGNMNDMERQLVNFKKGLEEYNLTKGHVALFFTSPKNDMGEYCKIIKNLSGRIATLKDLPQNTTAYQVALMDIRKMLSDINEPGDGWVWIHYEWWLLLTGMVALVGVAIFGIWSYAEYDDNRW